MKELFILARIPFERIEEQQNDFIKIKIKGEEISGGDYYHTIEELYDHRMALNIVLFNEWARQWKTIDSIGGLIELDYCPPYPIKSKLHHDGTMFDGKYFIVTASSRFSKVDQISYHYKLEHWDKFKIPEVDRAPEWDGHDSNDVIKRLLEIK